MALQNYSRAQRNAIDKSVKRTKLQGGINKKLNESGPDKKTGKRRDEKIANLHRGRLAFNSKMNDQHMDYYLEAKNDYADLMERTWEKDHDSKGSC